MFMHTRLLIGILLLVGIGIGMWTILQPPHHERTESIFVYGTLTNPIVRAYACWCITDSEPATLTGYYKVGRDVVASSTATTAGALIQVTPRELMRIDRYEGVPRNYQRIRVEVDGQPVWLYDQ